MRSCVPDLLHHSFRANPHWKDVASGDEALMIFQGPEGYITPNWYPSKAQHGKVVPTWNYAIVQAYGRPEVTENKDWLRQHVDELTRHYDILSYVEIRIPRPLIFAQIQ